MTSRRSPRRSRPACSPCVRLPPVGWPSTRLRSSCCPSSPVRTAAPRSACGTCCVTRRGCPRTGRSGGRPRRRRPSAGRCRSWPRASRSTARPATRAVYSDLGFILLGWLLERLTGTRLDVQFATGVTGPLALTSTMFMNLVDDPAARARTLSERSIAATQHCVGTTARADRRGRRSERDGDGRRRRPRGPVQHRGRPVRDRGVAGARLARRRRWRAGPARRGAHVLDAVRHPRIDVAPRLGRAGGAAARRPGRAFRARRSDTWASPAARCGSIPSARPGSSRCRTASTRRCRPTIAFAGFARRCTTRSRKRSATSAALR